MEHEFELWGQTCKVRVIRASLSVWFAVGEYAGRQIVTRGGSGKAALEVWKGAAGFWGKSAKRP